MLINYVPSAHGSRDLGPVRLEKGHSVYYGSEPVATKFMLFEFDNDMGSDTVGVQVICSDSEVSTDPTVLWWESGERGIKCIEFSDFSPPRNEDIAYGCQYQVQYLDLQTGDNPSSLSMSIYVG
jgi:hypothetical protein